MMLDDRDEEYGDDDQDDLRRRAVAMLRKQQRKENVALAQRFAARFISGFVPRVGPVPSVTPLPVGDLDMFIRDEGITSMSSSPVECMVARGHCMQRIDRGAKSSDVPVSARFQLKTITKGAMYHIVPMVRAAEDSARVIPDRVKKRVDNLIKDMKAYNRPDVMHELAQLGPVELLIHQMRMAFADTTQSVAAHLLKSSIELNTKLGSIGIGFKDMEKLIKPTKQDDDDDGSFAPV